MGLLAPIPGSKIASVLLALLALSPSEAMGGISSRRGQDKIGELVNFIEGSLHEDLTLPLSQALLKVVDGEIMHNERHPRLLWCRGILLERMDRKEEGRASRLKAIRIAEADSSIDHTKLIEYYKILAELQRDHGDITLAAELFVKVFQEDPVFAGQYKSFHPDYRLPTIEGGTGGISGTGKQYNHYISPSSVDRASIRDKLGKIEREWGPLAGFFTRYARSRQEMMRLLREDRTSQLIGRHYLEVARAIGFPDRYCFNHEARGEFCWVYTDDRPACKIDEASKMKIFYYIKGNYYVHFRFRAYRLTRIEQGP